MSDEIEQKLADLEKLLIKFQAIEEKVTHEEDRSLIISELMSISFVHNSKKVSKELTPAQRDQLKVGLADEKTLGVAQDILFPLISKAMVRIKNMIHQLQEQIKKKKANDSYSQYLKLLKKSHPDIEITSKESQQPGSSPTDIYHSYFSHSALQQLSEHIKTRQTPRPVRKYLTVCFIDLVGFSTMSEVIDSMQVMDVLNTFFNQVNQTIKKHKGDIDKFIGDAMLIIFETAEDAVRCSIEILLKDLDIINSQLEYLDIEEIKVHLGLNSGWVVQGNVGSGYRREITVIGDGVNIAARVQGLSPPNELWITESTLVGLGDIKSLLEPVGMRKLKGRVQEVMVYKHVRKVPPNCTVLFYEPDESYHETVREKMAKVGITDVILSTDIAQFQEIAQSDKVKVVVAGPSIDTSILEEMLVQVQKGGKKSLSTIPIIGTKNEKSKIPLYEKLGLKVYVSLYRDQSMEKITNVLINENVKAIPKLDKPVVPKAEKLEKRLAPFDTVAQAVTTDEIAQIVGDKPTAQKTDGHVMIHNEDDRIKLAISGLVSQDEIELFKQNLIHLWKYSFKEKYVPFVLSFKTMQVKDITDDYIGSFLKILDFMPEPRKVNVIIEFPEGKSILGLDGIKKKFKYRFES